MSVAYTLRTSARARRLRIAVHADGEIVVTTPRTYSERDLERFLAASREWIEKHRAKAKARTVIRVKRANIARLKREALALSSERCEEVAAHYGVAYRKISIRAQKSRWGSCSRHGNLSFNYKIALLSPRLRDYIVVHEVCHLIEMNHSAAFWRLVARTMPDHMALRKALRSIAFVFE